MIRSLKYSDKEILVNIINRIDIFSEEEKVVAVELIDEAIQEKGNEYYNIFVKELNNKVVGYHCTGKRALTDGVFDMYWIVVDPELKGKGIGKELLKHAEDFVLNNKGRLLLAETSSQECYNDTRKFYEKNNYSILADIKDFYKINDNLVVYGKYLKI